MNTPLYPLRFAPIFRPVLWGGYRIAPYKGILSEPRAIGESWELSPMEGHTSVVLEGALAGVSLTELMQKDGRSILGEKHYSRYGTRFPLLIKFIDAREDLSVQVHPSDALAPSLGLPHGKSEMWYIVDATKGARLSAGFAASTTQEQYQQAIKNGSITDLLRYDSIARGHLFYIPAGRIHTIGAGSFILEVQQALDVTYRIFDYNRLDSAGETRPLHLEAAEVALDFEATPPYRIDYREERNRVNVLLETPYFVFSTLPLTQPLRYMPPSGENECVVFVALEGSVSVRDCSGYEVELPCGHTLLFPASCLPAHITPRQKARLAAITISNTPPSDL